MIATRDLLARTFQLRAQTARDEDRSVEATIGNHDGRL